jgi:zinc protease
MSGPGDTRERIALPVEICELENGLRLLLLNRPHLPILSLSVLVRAGVALEGPGEEGLAAFTAGLFPQGTKRRSATRLAEEIEGLGASLGAHGDYDYTLLGFSCLSRHIEEAVGTLAEVLLTPAFEPAEIERKRNDIMSFLERQKDDPLALVRNRFIASVYGDHPYHHPREGTKASISRFTRADLLGFYEQNFTPGRTIVALVGDLDAPRARRLVEDAFGAWSGPRPGHAALPFPPPPGRLRVERIQKDGLTQATLRLGGFGLPRSSPEYPAAHLMNYVLGGGGFSSRLMHRLREEEGLTYGVGSDFRFRVQGGHFSIECQTAVERMDQAVREILAEVERLRIDGVEEAELEEARRFYTGSLPLGFQTSDQISTRLLERELYGLEEEFWLRDLERMRATSREQVLEVARRVLDPGRFTLVVLADFRKADLREEDL